MPPRSTQAAVERINRICRAHEDQRPLRLELLEALRTVVDFDWFAWLITDPETEVGAAPIASVPSLPDLPRLVRSKYLTKFNRWTHATSSVASWGGSAGDRADDPNPWGTFLREQEVGDVASLVFRDQFGCWAFLDLWRGGLDARFTTSELDHLAAVVAPITEAIRHCQAQTFQVAGGPLKRTGPAVLVLSPHLEVRAKTEETDELLRELIPTEDGRAPIPSSAYNVAAQLLAVEAGVDLHPPLARVHMSGGLWLTLRAARIGGPEPPARQDIAVTIEPTSPADRLSIFTRAHGLTGRESELLSHLSAGADTRQLAADMFVSENTIQDHLKAIFDKTGARTRRILLARALGI